MKLKLHLAQYLLIRILLSVTLFAFLFQLSFGQISKPILPPDWERIYIENIGSFDLPPTMEIQNGRYKEFMVEQHRVKGYDTPKLTAQQKGLNTYNNNSFNRYARVIFITDYGQSGDYATLDFNINQYSQSEISELNEITRQNTVQSFVGTEMKLIEWYPLKIESVNGMSCIHIKYKRKIADSPEVLVNSYYFQDFDKMHTVTLSYRISESSYWREDFAKILKSIRINKT